MPDGLTRGRRADGCELAPVERIDVERCAKARDDASALRPQAEEMEVGQRRQDVDRCAKFLAKRSDICAVFFSVARDRFGGTSEGQSRPGEGVAGGSFG